jgi:hypothetical protein
MQCGLLPSVGSYLQVAFYVAMEEGCKQMASAPSMPYKQVLRPKSITTGIPADIH